MLKLLEDSLTEKYSPFKILCLDESPLFWEDRFVFRQHIRAKRFRFGINIFKPVDEKGVTIGSKLYTGAIDTTEDFSKIESAVVNMMKDFLGNGNHVYTNNYYTTPKLLKFLNENKTDATGTIRNNRKGLPVELRILKLQKKKASI